MTATTALLLYLVFALGGAGVYLLLPKPGRSQALAGVVISVLALAALLIVLAARVIPSSGMVGYFCLFATIAVLGAVRVITHPKPVYSAVYFVLVVIAVAALLVLQRAEFLAIALIIIYAGAILVTYLFVIMLANQGGSPVYDRRSREPFLAVLAGFVLMAAIAGRAGDLPQPRSASTPRVGVSAGVELPQQMADSNTTGIGAAVMTKYVVALEIAGVLLLVSMIGAIALSRKKVPVEAFKEPPKPLGQVGREVEPY
ncbi:MAG: NADH-quinone oxidoreductase subunit J [Phycisphaerae bacterium]